MRHRSHQVFTVRVSTFLYLRLMAESCHIHRKNTNTNVHGAGKKGEEFNKLR